VLETSFAVAGFPTTILFAGIPLAIISFTDVPEKVPVAAVNNSV
jgi:hypothetical protein